MKSVYTLVDLAKELGVEYKGTPRLDLGNGYQVGLVGDVFTLYKDREGVLKSTPKGVVRDMKEITTN